MSEDLRNSLKLWAGGIAFIAIFWMVSRSNLLNGVIERVPPKWFWLVIGLVAIWNIGQFGLGLWRRRASNPRKPQSAVTSAFHPLRTFKLSGSTAE